MTLDRARASIYDWAVTANLQPEPITVEVWRNLPEEFCRQVEVVNGQVVRCEKPSRAHQAAATRVTTMLDATAEAHMERNPGTCLDTGTDSDVLLCSFRRRVVHPSRRGRAGEVPTRARIHGAAIAARVARPSLSPVASVRDNPLAQQGRQ